MQTEKHRETTHKSPKGLNSYLSRPGGCRKNWKEENIYNKKFCNMYLTKDERSNNKLRKIDLILNFKHFSLINVKIDWRDINKM